MQNFKKINFVLLIGLILSIVISIYTISEFDKYSDYFGNRQHKIIKGDAGNFYKRANIIKQDLDYNLEYREPFLPPRTIALFYKVINKDLYDFFEEDYTKKNHELREQVISSIDFLDVVKLDNGKIYFFILQSLIYYFSLFYFLKKLSLILDFKVVTICAFFLALEPTIMLFHSSFLSESIFLSLLLVIFGFLIKHKENFYSYLILGLLIGILYLQRSVSIYFSLIVIMYIVCFSKKKIYSVVSLLIGYFLVLTFLGFHNYKRSDNFYITAIQAKDGFWMYLVPQIIAKDKNISVNEAEIFLEKKIENWKFQNNITSEDLKKSEKLRLQKYSYQQKESFKIILQNIQISSKIILKKSIHFLVFDPLGHTYFFHKYDHKTPLSVGYYRSSDHKKFIIPRVIYSFIIYLVCFVGLFFIKNDENKKYLYLFFISLIYFTIVQSWIGNNRYSTPNLILLSPFFSVGLCGIYELIRSLFNKIKIS